MSRAAHGQPLLRPVGHLDKHLVTYRTAEEIGRGALHQDVASPWWPCARTWSNDTDPRIAIILQYGQLNIEPLIRVERLGFGIDNTPRLHLIHLRHVANGIQHVLVKRVQVQDHVGRDVGPVAFVHIDHSRVPRREHHTKRRHAHGDGHYNQHATGFVKPGIPQHFVPA